MSVSSRSGRVGPPFLSVSARASKRFATLISVALLLTAAPPFISTATAAGIGFGSPIELNGNRHGEPGIRVQRNDLAGGDTSGDRAWVHAFESGWRSDDGGRNWTGEIGTSLALSGDSDMAWGYPGGPNPERIYKTELNTLVCEQFFWDDDGSGGATVTDWMRDDTNCGIPSHDRQWLQTGPAVLPDGSILEGAEHMYMIANQIPTGGFLARSTQVLPAQPPHFDFTTPFQTIASDGILWCTRGFFDVDQEDGSLHIIDCLENGDLRVYSSYDGGITWVEEQVTGHRNSTNLFPVISVDDAGGLHVSSSQTNGDLVYSYRPEDGAWTDPVTIVVGDGSADNAALNTTALAWVDAGEAGKANIVYLGTTAGPDPDHVAPPNQWHLWMSQTLDGGQTWSHAQADQHAVQTGCISTAGLPLTGPPDCPNRNLVDFIAADHLSDGSAVISYTYGCPSSTGCDGVTGQSNGAETRVVVQDTGSKIRGDGPIGEPALNITSPEDGATVQEGIVEVAGVADREGGSQALTANLTGPTEVSNGSAATYSLTATNAQGNLTCTITAEGSPARANESADGCSVELTWASDGSYTVFGEATDGTSSALDSVQVTVSTPSGIPEPDGSISGQITMFADANPLLAVNEVAALAASPVDPAPKFLPGESVTFHTRFTEDATSAVATSGDTFKWHIWNTAGELVGTFPCVTSPDADLTAPSGFDCEASAALPSDIGRYYTTLQYTKDGRWSCHGQGPLENLVLPSGIPQCLKAFDIVANTDAAGNPLPGEDQGSHARMKRAMPYLVLLDGKAAKELAWNARGKVSSASSADAAVTAEPAGAPSDVPEDPEIVDATGDALQVTNPGAGLPVDHLDVEAAWFENDDDFLYVGMKLVDIPADPNSTAFAAYHVNFRPDWVADPKTAFAVPAANTYTGLRVQGMFSPVGFNGLNPVTEMAHRAELQVLSTSATGNNFAKVADLQLLSVSSDTDIVWWAVPRPAIKDPQPDDALENLSADAAVAMRGRFTLGVDSAPAEVGRKYTFGGGVSALSASAGGPYSGAVNAPIPISGTATGGTAPYTCAWTGPAGASFANASACNTTVSFANAGNFTLGLTVNDSGGQQASATAPVSVGAAPSGERVEIYVDGSTLAGSSAITTDAGSPTAQWTIPANLTGLSGDHTITARWIDGDGSVLGEDSISLTIEGTTPEFEINITSPSDGAEVESDFLVEGTTAGTSESEAAGHGSRSSTKWKRAVKVIPADHLKVTSHGPPVPADSVGIGPGSTLLTNFIDPADGLEYVGICTAAFIFRDPNTGKVYIGAAGHCFIAPGATSTHGPGANWDRDLTLRVRVCVSTCFGGASGLLSAATLDMYPGTTRDLGELAYARQTAGAVDVGNDFGIVEIPPALHDEIRTDLPVWNGPNTAEPLLLEGGEFLAHYGNGIGVGEVFPTKARMGIGAAIDGGSWLAALASSQGDSGSAVIGAEVTVGAATSVDGLAPLGMLTHLVCCLIAGNPYTTAGTTVARAIQMAREDAGINLELIHNPSQLATTVPAAPTGLAATASDGTVGLSWTAPSNGGSPITSYTVKWGTQAGGPYTDTETVSGTQASIDGLTNGVTYHFVVSATNAEGEGPNSLEVSATPTRLSTVPGAPLDLSALAGDGQVSLAWQPPTDDGNETITGYTVKWGPTAGGPYPSTIPVTDTSTTVTGLTNGATYHFVVSATNANGEGADSSEVEATPQALESPFSVEVRLGSSGEWIAADAYDGSAWSKGFTDVSDGPVTVEARLLDEGTEVARDSIGLTVAGTGISTVAFTDDSADAGQYSDEATIAARLTDEAGDPISGAELVFELTGANGVEQWPATTGADGVGSVTRTLNGAPGAYNLTVNYAGETDVYDPDSDQKSFTILKEQTVIDLSVSGTGSARTLTATASHDDPTALGGVEVVFSADGTEIGSAITNGRGIASLHPSAPFDKGAHDFEASFAGDNNFVGSSDIAATGEDATTLAFTDATDARGAYSDNARVEISLIDEAGDVVVGEPVRFELTGPGGSRSWSVSTNANGIAGRTISLSELPGDYTLVARYDGRVRSFSGSSADTTFVVEKETTALDLSVAGKGSKRTITATLSENDGPAVAGQQIVFFANGTEIGRATTNAAGVATLATPSGHRGGSFNFEARFAGNDYYRSSSGSDQT